MLQVLTVKPRITEKGNGGCMLSGPQKRDMEILSHSPTVLGHLKKKKTSDSKVLLFIKKKNLLQYTHY